jgi:pimeloyl-ACP methyl ester carboxylesterase
MREQRFVIDYSGRSYDISTLIRERSKIWILCLHGIQSNKALFINLLAQPFFDNYSFVAPDFVGFGNSSKPENFSYDLRDQAKICVQLAGQLGIKRVYVIGHSLGGMVATLLLQELGDTVEGILNLEGNFEPADAGVSREIARQSLDEFQSRGYQSLKSSISASGEPSAASRLDWLKSTPDYAIYKTAQSIMHWSATDRLLQQFVDASIKKLYIYGDKNSEKARRLPAVIPKLAIPNSGHFMLLDQPTTTFSALENFLSKN